MHTNKLKYHYFYKITNNLNNHFYYGVHNTNNLNDGYMGSGKRLHYAYKKYGIENFTKEILKFFDTSKDAFEYEAEIVTDTLITDSNCYNIKQGGDGWQTIGLVTVKDKDGNCFDVHRTDERYVSGELHGYSKGKTVYYDTINNINVSAPINDIRITLGILIPCCKNKVILINKQTGETVQVYKDKKLEYLNKGFQYPMSNKIVVKNSANVFFVVDKDDPRVKSGELQFIWKNRKHTKETKEKQKEVFKKIKHQLGEKNSQYGTCWITKNNINKKINKNELLIYLKDDWVLGRYVELDPSYPTYDEICEQYSILKSYKDVAKHFNISKNTLLKIRRLYEN